MKSDLLPSLSFDPMPRLLVTSVLTGSVPFNPYMVGSRLRDRSLQKDLFPSIVLLGGRAWLAPTICSLFRFDLIVIYIIE